MTNWRPDFDPAHLYFVTTTAVQRAHIFQRDVIKRILVDGLYYLHIMDRTELYAFVIMPNHVHLIIRCREDYPMKDLMRDFKANMTRLIVWQYQAEGNQQVLDFLAAAVTRPEKQEFKVWEDGYNAKDVFTVDFLLQKLEYTHNNPLQPHWRLVERAEDCIWSSARFYLLDEPALIPLSDVRELF
jgi:putative transposase